MIKAPLAFVLVLAHLVLYVVRFVPAAATSLARVDRALGVIEGS